MNKIALLSKLLVARLPEPLLAVLYRNRPVVDGRTIDPKAYLLGEVFNALRKPGVIPTIEESRRSLATLAERFDAVAPADVNKHDTEIPGADGPRRVRIYDVQPLTDKNRPVLLFVHGGGWVQGSIETHDGLCAQIASEAGIRVMSLDYRLAPEHPMPAGLDDTVAAYRALRADPDRFGIDADRIAMGGDSAGGNLTGAALHDLQVASEPLPAAQVLIYPAMDASMETPSMIALADGYVLSSERMEWYFQLYAGENPDPKSPRLSPIHSPHLSGQPPAVIVAAGHDPLWDDGVNYANALRDAGVPVEWLPYEGQIHVFASMRRAMPQGRDAVTKISHWLSRQLA